MSNIFGIEGRFIPVQAHTMTDKIKFFFWWIIQLMIFISYTIVIIDYGDADAVPIAGAVLTMVSYIIFTREKGNYDANAKMYQNAMIDAIAREYMANEQYNRSNFEDYQKKQKYDLELANYEIEKVKDDLERFKSGRSSRNNSMDMVPSYLSRRKNRPMRPILYGRTMHTSIDFFWENIQRHKRSAAASQKMADRFAKLEFISIMYLGGMTIFGADIVEKWGW